MDLCPRKENLSLLLLFPLLFAMKLWSNILGGNFCFPSKLPYDVTPEQALSHEEVRTRLDNSIRNMRAVTDKFLAAIISSVDKIP